MTMTPQSLEGQIRQGAVYAAHKKVRQAIEALANFQVDGFNRPLSWTDVSLEMHGKLSVARLLEEIETAFNNEMAQPVGDHAVKQFIAKIESLEADLDELRDQVQYQGEG